MLAGAGLVAAAAFVACAAAAGWRQMWWSWAVFPLTRYSQHAHKVRLMTWGPTAAAQLALCAAGVLAALGAWRRRAARERMIAAAGVGALVASSHRFYPVIYPQGLAIGSVLLAVSLTAALARALRSPSPGPRLAGAMTCAALLPGLLWGSLGLIARRQTMPLLRETHRAGEVWLRDPMPDLRWLEACAAEGERVFVFPLRGGVQFLTHTLNATSFPYFLRRRSGFHTAQQIEQAAAELERAAPRCGVWMGRGHDDAHLWPMTDVLARSYTAEPLGGELTGYRLRENARAAPDTPTPR
jgi:hypothetical protein